MRAELGEQGLHVAPQGAGGDVHLLGHLPGALAIDDPAEHLLLPRGELVQPPVTPGHPGHRAAGQARLEHRPARRDLGQCLRYLRDVGVLAEESGYAEFSRLPGNRRVGRPGQYYDRGARMTLPDRTDPGQAVLAGETQADQARVRSVRADCRQSPGQRSGDRGYLVTAGRQRRRERLTEQQVVVTEHKSHGLPKVSPGYQLATGGGETQPARPHGPLRFLSATAP